MIGAVLSRPVRGRPVGAAASLELDRPIADVWAAVADLERWPAWQPGVRSASLGGVPVERGLAFKLRAPWPANAWVTRLEPPHRLEVLAFPDGLGLREETAFVLSAVTVGRTRVSLERRATGVVGPVWARVARPSPARVLEALARRLDRELPAGG